MGDPDLKDFDTVIVPMPEDALRDVFLRERRWPNLRLSPRSRKQLRFIAAYQTAPVCAVTHIAEIEGFAAGEREGRFDAVLAGPPTAIAPIPFLRGLHARTIQSPRFLKLQILVQAANLNELIDRRRSA